MFLLYPLIIFYLTAILLGIVRVIWPGFVHSWLIAGGGILSAWILAVVSYSHIPFRFVLLDWQSQDIFSASPMLLLDEISWPYVIALITLTLGAILTSVMSVGEPDDGEFISALTITGFGLISVMASNLLTLILAWSVVDLLELILLLKWVGSREERDKTIRFFTLRVAGLFFLFFGWIQAFSDGMHLNLDSIPPQVGGFLIVAACLRLGFFAPQRPSLKPRSLERRLGTVLHFVPAAGGLLLATRCAVSGVSQSWLPALLSLTTIGAVISSIAWINSSDELDGRPYWITGMGVFSITAALLTKSYASLTWGVAVLFSGGLLFLTSIRHRRMIVLSIFGLGSFAALPYSPSWDGTQIIEGLKHLFSDRGGMFSIVFAAIFILVNSLFFYGYLRKTMGIKAESKTIDNWRWIIYSIGLVLIPISHYGISYWAKVGLQQTFKNNIAWLWGAVLIMTVGLFSLLERRRNIFGHYTRLKIITHACLDWFGRLVCLFFHTVGKIINTLNHIYEGQGGVIWAILFITLVVAYVVR